MASHPDQWVQGNQNVQISEISGSTIHITLKDSGRSWHVALEPATAPVGARVTSPARLVRARSGVLPYVDRAGHLEHLSDWIGAPEPFAVCLIGGHGGTGKTRLGVELCERTAAQAGWLSGLLPRYAKDAGLRDLYNTPNARLVVIDYAETRIEQLLEVLPELHRAASPEYPVRVLLLVRKAPQRSSDWTEALSMGSEWLESALDDAAVRILDETPPDLGDRRTLFDAAAAAFARRADLPVSLSEVSVPDMTGNTFANSLFLVIAAYLAVHPPKDQPAGSTGLRLTPPDLLERLISHEGQYWNSLSRAQGLDIDDTLQRRVVALATLAGAGAGGTPEADAEAEAAQLLRYLPDFSGESAERRHRIARWVHSLYPGPFWWNPVEPDLLGEYLVSSSLAGFPDVLAGALNREHPDNLVQPLEVYARIAAGDDRFANAIRPVFSTDLEWLCWIAVEQVAAGEELVPMLRASTVAGALARAASVIIPDPSVLPAALDTLPLRSDVILNGLMLTLTDQLAKDLRKQSEIDPAAWNPDLAHALNNLSIHLADTGRLGEALETVTEAVELYRSLADDDPAAFNPHLATCLGNLSNYLARTGHSTEALETVTEAVELYRSLADDDRAAFNPALAQALSNLSVSLSELGRLREALWTSDEAVDLYRGLAAADPVWMPGLAAALNNLSNRFADAGYPDTALRIITEAVKIRRDLATAEPAAYNPDLAAALNTLSNHLASTGRREEALAPMTEAVQIHRDLAAAEPAAYNPDLAAALNALSNHLASTGRREEALAPIIEAVKIQRELAAADRAASNLSLANALHNLCYRLSDVGRSGEALPPIIEAVHLYRGLAAADPAAYNPDLAMALNNLSVSLADNGHREEALAPIIEAVKIRRKLAAAHPAVFNPDLAISLNNLSYRLADIGRRDEALSVQKEMHSLSGFFPG